MKVLRILICLMLISSNCFALTNLFRVDEPEGSTRYPNDVSDYIIANNQAFQRLLAGYRDDCKLVYATAAAITVQAGEVMCTDGTTYLMLANTSSTSVTFSDIDTGAEASSTTYYIYAGTSTSTDTTFTCYISTSSSAPSGVTYYARLGSFYNDASSNIQEKSINNDSLSEWTDINSSYIYDSGWFAVSIGGTYTKTHSLGTDKTNFKLYFSTDSSGSNMTTVTYEGHTGSGGTGGVITDITSTTMTIQAADNKVVDLLTTSGDTDEKTSGYYRVIALALD